MAETVRVPKDCIPTGPEDELMGLMFDLATSEGPAQATFRVVGINRYTVTAERIGPWVALDAPEERNQ